MSTTFVATAGLETAPIHEGSVLYNPKTGKFIMLNRSAAFLWSELSTPKTEDELNRLLCSAFCEVATPEQDISEAIGRLKELELVVCNGATTGVEPPTPARGSGNDGKDQPLEYERPSLRVLDEEELLEIFQMTAAEISLAACWWSPCSSGCP